MLYWTRLLLPQQPAHPPPPSAPLRRIFCSAPHTSWGQLTRRRSWLLLDCALQTSVVPLVHLLKVCTLLPVRQSNQSLLTDGPTIPLTDLSIYYSSKETICDSKPEYSLANLCTQMQCSNCTRTFNNLWIKATYKLHTYIIYNFFLHHTLWSAAVFTKLFILPLGVIITVFS